VVASCAACVPGEEENFEEMVDSQEFRRDVLGEGEAGFCGVPFSVEVLSVDVLLEKPGRWGIGFGAVGAGSFT
jgi:hypothetical protein